MLLFNVVLSSSYIACPIYVDLCITFRFCLYICLYVCVCMCARPASIHSGWQPIWLGWNNNNNFRVVRYGAIPLVPSREGQIQQTSMGRNEKKKTLSGKTKEEAAAANGSDTAQWAARSDRIGSAVFHFHQLRQIPGHHLQSIVTKTLVLLS